MKGARRGGRTLQKGRVSAFYGCEPPRLATGVSRPLWAQERPGVPPKTGGVRGSVRPGFSEALRAPGSGVSIKCPESVPECPGHLFDTDFLRALEPGAARASETPRRTLPQAPPVFGGTSGILRASCSRPGGSQLYEPHPFWEPF